MKNIPLFVLLVFSYTIQAQNWLGWPIKTYSTSDSCLVWNNTTKKFNRVLIPSSGITSVYSANSDILVDSSVTWKRKITLNKSLTSGYINIGDGTNTAFPRQLSGDATLSNTGALTIANSAVTNAKLANSSLTVNGALISLGGSATVTANTPNSLTINNSGAGDASGSTFNGSAGNTLSYNSIGAAPVSSPTFTGTVTIPSGAILNTPASIVGTNITGTALGLIAGNVTTNANSTGDITSVGNVTSYNNVVPSTKGGAGTINGILKANGSGTVSLASSETDYLNLTTEQRTYMIPNRTSVGVIAQTNSALRDPSNIIKVGNTYYVYFTRVPNTSPTYPNGYEGTIYVASSTDKATWTIVGEVIAKGGSGTFDEKGCFTPAVYYDGTTIWLVYTGVDGTFNFPTVVPKKIGLASSTSPTTGFTKSGLNPIILPGSAGQWDDLPGSIDDCNIIYTGTEYRIYYCGSRVSAQKKTGYVYASSMSSTWTKYASNPVVQPTNFGYTTSDGFEAPCIFYHLGRYHYLADVFLGGGGGSILRGLVKLYSLDGISWILDPRQPLLSDNYQVDFGSIPNVSVLAAATYTENGAVQDMVTMYRNDLDITISVSKVTSQYNSYKQEKGRVIANRIGIGNKAPVYDVDISSYATTGARVNFIAPLVTDNARFLVGKSTSRLVSFIWDETNTRGSIGTFDGTTMPIYINNSFSVLNGKIGLGTASPSEVVDLSTSITTLPRMQFFASGVTDNIRFTIGKNSTRNVQYLWDEANSRGTLNTQGLSFPLTFNGIASVYSNGLYLGALGVTPTAVLHLKAGTANANTAPQKNTAGVLLTTPEALASEVNASSFYKTTVALNRFAQGGKIYGTSTDVSNTSTTETDLITYTTKANTLVATDESLVFDLSGTFNDVTATSQLQFYFGGTNIGNTGALTVSATGGWSARVIIIRSGASTAKAVVTVATPGASTASYTTTTSMTGLTFSGTNIIKVTGTAGGAGGGTGDITGSAGQLMWWGASNN